MDEHQGHTRLTRQEISDAVTGLGWRYILGAVQTRVRVGSLAQAVAAAERAAATASGHSAASPPAASPPAGSPPAGSPPAGSPVTGSPATGSANADTTSPGTADTGTTGPDTADTSATDTGATDASMRVDLRSDQVIFTLQSPETGWVTRREIELAGQISAAVVALGLVTDAAIGARPRSVQIMEIAIDALDIAAVRPFWKAVLGYRDDPGETEPLNGLIDPAGQGPSVWFQQMDEPRPQRNRIHFDISVPHDEAAGRIAAALAADGKLLSDDAAPAFWVLADPEGNEACVTTWQGRDH